MCPGQQKKKVIYMSIVYKFDVLAALKEKGYSQNRMRVEKLIGQSYLTQLRQGELVSWKAIEFVRASRCLKNTSGQQNKGKKCV